MIVQNNGFSTSESVSPGHPDKVCDQISDAILDAILLLDNDAKVAVETLVTDNNVIISGEINSTANIDYELIVRNKIKEIGYTNNSFNWQKIKYTNLIHQQSQDISQAVVKNCGAGDQGIMCGYACGDDTTHYMPSPIFYAHKIMRNLNNLIKAQKVATLGPDAKCQVTLQLKNNHIISIPSILLSVQHDKNLLINDVKDLIYNVIYDAFSNGLVHEKNININSSGRFIIGGPEADTGLTGRKIISDTYGCGIPHGGGAFSGKDPTKVDRSAAYMARYIAKNIVASGIAKTCLIQVAYALGIAQPISVTVNTYETAIVPESEILKAILKIFDFTPLAIKKILHLDQPIYSPTATFGHFGREHIAPYFSWEELNKVHEIQKMLG